MASHQHAPELDHILSQVFEESPDAIMLISASGTIVAVNRSYEEITGYSSETILGRQPTMLNSGFHDPAFFARMRDALTKHGRWQGEVWDRTQDGRAYAQLLSLNEVRNGVGSEIYYLGIFRDITQLKQTEARLQHVAQHDPLTGLPNRLLFLDRLRQAMSRVERNGLQLGLMYLDLDQFKSINDVLGHRAGDLFLASVAERLRRVVRESDTVARLGGDEFTIIQSDVKTVQDVTALAQKVISAFHESFVVEGRELRTSTSMGICLYPFDGATVDKLIKNADIAMYEAKNRGKNQFKFFSAKMQAESIERLETENQLRQALPGHQFILHYQPKVNVTSMEITGAEALIRWHHPKNGLVLPQKFIPVAEESGFIGAIGDWVIQRACQQAAVWQAESHPPVKIWINVAGKQFAQSDIFDKIQRTLSQYRIPPHLLGIEITESTVMFDMHNTARTLKKLADLGVEIAVDDFGTGHSSLAYLKKFPINYLKIPYEFIHHVENEDDRSIIRAIIALASNLGLKVVAEGVETVPQYQFLKELGCDEIQGFLFSRAIPAEELSGFFGSDELAKRAG